MLSWTLAIHAAWQSAWTMPSRSAGRTFAVSVGCREVSKPCSDQTSRRTAARASEKVGCFLRYQAAAETRPAGGCGGRGGGAAGGRRGKSRERKGGGGRIGRAHR